MENADSGGEQPSGVSSTVLANVPASIQGLCIMVYKINSSSNSRSQKVSSKWKFKRKLCHFSVLIVTARFKICGVIYFISTVQVCVRCTKNI